MRDAGGRSIGTQVGDGAARYVLGKSGFACNFCTLTRAQGEPTEARKGFDEAG